MARESTDTRDGFATIVAIWKHIAASQLLSALAILLIF
jgi:hypothetical protein